MNRTIGMGLEKTKLKKRKKNTKEKKKKKKTFFFRFLGLFVKNRPLKVVKTNKQTKQIYIIKKN